MTRDPPRSISLFCCLFFGSVHQGPARRDPELGPWAPPLPRPDLSPRTGLLLGPSAAVCSGGGRSGASLVGSPMAPVGVPPPAPLQLNGCAVPTLPEAPQTRPGKLASRPNQRPTRRFHHPPEPRGAAPGRSGSAWTGSGRHGAPGACPCPGAGFLAAVSAVSAVSAAAAARFRSCLAWQGTAAPSRQTDGTKAPSVYCSRPIAGLLGGSRVPPEVEPALKRTGRCRGGQACDACAPM